MSLHLPLDRHRRTTRRQLVDQRRLLSHVRRFLPLRRLPPDMHPLALLFALLCRQTDRQTKTI